MQRDVQTWLAARGGDFECLPNGRIRCLLNGSEFVPDCKILSAFIEGKKYKKLKERQERSEGLRSFEPFFVPSRNFEDQIYCALTGQLIGTRGDDIEAHMKGKKFRKAKEALLENRRELKPEPDIADLMADIDTSAHVESKNEAETASSLDCVDAMEIDDTTERPPDSHIEMTINAQKRKHYR